MWLRIPRGCSCVLAFVLFIKFTTFELNALAQQTRAKELLQNILKAQRARLQNGTVMLILQRHANIATLPKSLYLVTILEDKTRCEMYVVPPNVALASKEEIGFIFQGTSGLPTQLVLHYSDGYYFNNDGEISIGSGKIVNFIPYFRFLNAVISSLDFHGAQIQKHKVPAPYVGVKIRRSDRYQLSKNTVEPVEYSNEVWLDPEHDGLATRLSGTQPMFRSDPQNGEDEPGSIVYFTWQAEVKAFAKSHGVWYPQIVMTKEMNPYISPDFPDFSEDQENRWEVLGFCTGVDLPISIFGSSPNRQMNADSAWPQVAKWIVLNLPQQPVDETKGEK